MEVGERVGKLHLCMLCSLHPHFFATQLEERMEARETCFELTDTLFKIKLKKKKNLFCFSSGWILKGGITDNPAHYKFASCLELNWNEIQWFSYCGHKGDCGPLITACGFDSAIHKLQYSLIYSFSFNCLQIASNKLLGCWGRRNSACSSLEWTEVRRRETQSWCHPSASFLPFFSLLCEGDWGHVHQACKAGNYTLFAALCLVQPIKYIAGHMPEATATAIPVLFNFFFFPKFTQAFSGCNLPRRPMIYRES